MQWSKEKAEEIASTGFTIKFAGGTNEPKVEIRGTPDGFAVKMAYVLVRGYEIGVLDDNHIEMIKQVVTEEVQDIKKKGTRMEHRTVKVENDEIFIQGKRLTGEKADELKRLLREITGTLIDDEEEEEDEE